MLEITIVSKYLIMSGAEGQGPEKGQSSKAGAADKGQASKTGALKRQYQFRHSESDSDSVSYWYHLYAGDKNI